MQSSPSVGYPSRVLSLFRRKSTEPVEAPVTEVTPEEKPVSRARGYTPSKRELGVVTPKRPSMQPRRVGAVKPLSKEEAREERRRRRAEAAAEYRKEGGPRDRGPERALVRNVVDSRRTIGTWFLGGALLVLFFSNPQVMPPIVVLAAEVLWLLLGLGVILDSVLICRRVKKLVRQRFPKTKERMGSLYFYAIMRAITFRRMRIPIPSVKIGEPV